MKKYCPNCGYGNEYIGNIPQTCEKCQTSFATMIKQMIKERPNINQLTQDSDNNIPDPINEIEGSEFDSYMEEQPESMSEEEISKIFLAGGSTGFNLGKFIEQELKKNGVDPVKPKRRTPKSK